MTLRPVQASLWPALPAQPTGTQVAAAVKLAPKVRGMAQACLRHLERVGLATAREVAEATGIDLVTARARLTGLHGDGLIQRTALVRDGQLVYCALATWKPELGSVPLRRHKGQR